MIFEKVFDLLLLLLLLLLYFYGGRLTTLRAEATFLLCELLCEK